MVKEIRRALISVSDKSNLLEFARYLASKGVEILSTGGTARMLVENGIAVIEVSEYTGFPEMMDGRVKTLHPRIHGGILGRRGIDDAQMSDNDIQAIDLVVVNLYPFQQTISRSDCSLDMAIENIDIGGPTMIRAAAKNHKDVTVVVDSADYQTVMDELSQNKGAICEQLRFKLAVKTFEHTAKYDAAVANYLGSLQGEEKNLFPNTFNCQFIKSQEMRYGENPHQKAAFYVSENHDDASVSTANQIQGKALSYNNIADTDAALECVKQFDGSNACVIVKHANPCGVAVDSDIRSAYQKAYSTDPESAFGGIIAFNQQLDGHTAQAIIDQQFVEVIIAPKISPEAGEILCSKQNIRVLECGNWDHSALCHNDSSDFVKAKDFKKVAGGLLIQETDTELYQSLDVVTERPPSDAEMEDLIFAWKVAKFVKSNAIIYVSGKKTIGVGAGQMSRVNSARIAAIKAQHAGLEVKGAVMASDAFFPFRDGLDNAAQVGVRAVIQPGGSIRDEEVIAAANEHDIAMVFTRMRHFRH